MRKDYKQEYYLLKNSIEDALNNRPINKVIEKILKNALDGGCYNCIYISFKPKRKTYCRICDLELTGNWVQEKPTWCPYLNKNG